MAMLYCVLAYVFFFLTVRNNIIRQHACLILQSLFCFAVGKCAHFGSFAVTSETIGFKLLMINEDESRK